MGSITSVEFYSRVHEYYTIKEAESSFCFESIKYTVSSNFPFPSTLTSDFVLIIF